MTNGTMEQVSIAKGTQISANQVCDVAMGVPTVLHVTQKHIILALSKGAIYVFDIQENYKKSLLISQAASQAAVWALAVEEEILASGGADNAIELWNLSTGEHPHTLQGHTSTVRALVILKDGKRIISASRDTTLRVWNTTNKECAIAYGHSDTVRVIALSRQQDILVSGSHDREARVWRITEDGLVCLHTLQGHTGTIFSVGFAGVKESQIVTAGEDSSIRLWSLEYGGQMQVLTDHSDVVNRVVATSSKLVSADKSGFICVWKLDDIANLKSRVKAQNSILVSMDSDEKSIVSGGKDGAIMLQDLESGELIGKLGEAGTVVWKVAFVRNGRVASVICRESQVMMEVWDVN